MAREHRYFVYLLTNWNNKVMYVGMTNSLERRVFEHKAKLVEGFTAKYNVHKLVYFEETSSVNAAITREKAQPVHPCTAPLASIPSAKEIKKWRREKKNALVVQANPRWRDLSEDFSQAPSLCSGQGSK